MRSCAGDGVARALPGVGCGIAGSPLVAASNPTAANAMTLLPTPTPPRRIAASNAVRGNGSAPEPASAPNSTALNALPVASASAAMSNATSRLAASRQADSRLGGIGAAVAERDLLGHREHAVRRGDQQGPLGRDETTLHSAPCLHQLGADHDVDLAGHRHQRQDGSTTRAIGRTMTST